MKIVEVQYERPTVDAPTDASWRIVEPGPDTYVTLVTKRGTVMLHACAWIGVVPGGTDAMLGVAMSCAWSLQKGRVRMHCGDVIRGDGVDWLAQGVSPTRIDLVQQPASGVNP